MIDRNAFGPLWKNWENTHRVYFRDKGILKIRLTYLKVSLSLYTTERKQMTSLYKDEANTQIDIEDILNYQ